MTEFPTNGLIERILDVWPLEKWQQFNVIVAVSGGADSVALLKSLCLIREQHKSARCTGSLIAAHFNHRLRGRDSDLDAAFVSGLAKKLGVAFYADEADGCVSTSEENLRDVRYRFLANVARQTNSRYIATAHHREDQIETVLFRLFRGTGVRGLCGIPPQRVVDESLTIIRPMLDVGKKEILSTLKAWGQPFRMDATNDQSTYTRNFIRNEILPLVRERFPAPDASIARLSKQACQQQEFLQQQVLPLLKHVEFGRGSVKIDCGPLQKLPVVILREFVFYVLDFMGWSTASLGFESIEIVASLIVCDQNRPRFQLPGLVNCQKNDECLTLFTKQ